jgi:hypothetical protein
LPFKSLILAEVMDDRLSSRAQAVTNSQLFLERHWFRA